MKEILNARGLETVSELVQYAMVVKTVTMVVMKKTAVRTHVAS